MRHLKIERNRQGTMLVMVGELRWACTGPGGSEWVRLGPIKRAEIYFFWRQRRSVVRTPLDGSCKLGRVTALGETVLIVEDNTDLRGMFRTALNLAGFNTLEAGDGLAALKLIDQV